MLRGLPCQSLIPHCSQRFCFEPLGKKSEFEMMPACPSADDEQVLDRHGPRARYDVASLFGLVPASEIEAEPPRAFTD